MPPPSSMFLGLGAFHFTQQRLHSLIYRDEEIWVKKMRSGVAGFLWEVGNPPIKSSHYCPQVQFEVLHASVFFFRPTFWILKEHCAFFPLQLFPPRPLLKELRSWARPELRLNSNLYSSAPLFTGDAGWNWERRVTEPHIRKFYLYTNTLGHLHTKGRNNRPSSVSFSPSLSLPLLRSLLGSSWRSRMTGGILC